MHLGNGAVTPACAVVGLSVAGLGMGAASLALRASGVPRSKWPTAAVLGAGVFAAQAVNVPVGQFTSAHLVGGVLLAWMLGPALGAVSMAGVLLLQALLLGDGGLMALGWNIVNMGLLPAGLVMLGRRSMSEEASLLRRSVVSGTSAALAVLLAAALIVGEVALFRNGTQLAGLGAFAVEMLKSHLVFGLAEGLLTVALLAMLAQLGRQAGGVLTPARLWSAAAVSLLLVVAALLVASPMPDGYERALAVAGMKPVMESVTGINEVVAGWQASVNAWFPVEWLALAAGTLLAALVVPTAAMMLGRRSRASL